MRDPFFSRVLGHLVGLDRRVPRRVAVDPERRVVLELMPRRQELHAVAPQFAGQSRRRDALGEAAEDQDDLGGTPLHPLQGRPGPGVEDAAARRAAIVEDRVAMAAVDPESVAGAAPGAGHPAGMEEVDELSVAGILVEEVGDPQVHGDSLRDRVRSPEHITSSSRRQEASTEAAS